MTKASIKSSTEIKSMREIATNPDEILYLVDGQDREIGTIVRSVANDNPIYIHREIGIIIFNQNRQLLLQKRSKYKKVHPGWWSITAGHISYGDSIEQTVKKELEEELSLDLDTVFLTKKLNRYTHEQHFMYYYLAYYNQAEPSSVSAAQVKQDSRQRINFLEAEVEQVKFYSQEDFLKLKQTALINLKHESVLMDFWQKKYKSQEKKLLH